MESLKLNKSVVICALARDCAEALKNNIVRIEKLRTFFESSEVIVIENDSIDDTKEVLLGWQRGCSGVNVISNDYLTQTIRDKDSSNPSPGTSMDRIVKMAVYRNKYLDWIKNNNRKFDYVLMIDVDVECFSINGILDSIRNAPENWGGLFAYGYTDTKVGSHKFYKIFHDLYAFLENMPLSKPYLTHTQMFKTSKSINKKLKGHRYLPVVSAFGGMGIYKFGAIVELKYKSISNEDPLMEAVCEHIPFNMDVIKRGYQNYVCTQMEVYYGKSSNLKVLRNLVPLSIFKLMAIIFTFKRLKA